MTTKKIKVGQHTRGKGGTIKVKPHTKKVRGKKVSVKGYVKRKRVSKVKSYYRKPASKK